MTKQEVFEKTVQIFTANFSCSAEQITPESRLMEEMDLTSLEILLMVAEIEDAFSIRLSDEDLLNIVTMNDLTEVIWEKAR